MFEVTRVNGNLKVSMTKAIYSIPHVVSFRGEFCVCVCVCVLGGGRHIISLSISAYRLYCFGL